MLLGGSDEDQPIQANITIATEEIPAGTFTMGSPNSEVGRNDMETQHQVTLSAFRMSKYEITNAEYAVFLNAKGVDRYGHYPEGPSTKEILVTTNTGWGVWFSNNQWVPVEGFENHPVVDVTWFGAAEFAAYAGGRLPTEAEWEYASRGNTNTPFNTGTCLSSAEANYAWDAPYNNCTNTNSTDPDRTQPVGTYAPNAFGLYDLHGNVWEWCSDFLQSYPIVPQTNPTGPEDGVARIFRGGSWHTDARFCRSAFRQQSYVEEGAVGFRIVVNVP